MSDLDATTLANPIAHWAARPRCATPAPRQPPDPRTAAWGAAALGAWLALGAGQSSAQQAVQQAPQAVPQALQQAAEPAGTAASAVASRVAGQDGAFVRVPGGAWAPTTDPGPDTPKPRPCPDGLPAGTQCHSGRDLLGAHLLMAMPADWNGALVVHVHGGPELGKPTLARTEADLKRWSVFARAGYAWVASSFRQGGVEVRAAGEDSERARQAFVQVHGTPLRTVLHGQSWGAGVAARMAERYTTPDVFPRHGAAGRPPYDGVLLTSGVLGGAPRAYDMRLDLRVVYQALCNNHPRPDEPAYPLWMGLPLPAPTDPRAGSTSSSSASALDAPPAHKLTREELARRVDECTGVQRPAAQRSAAQQQALDTLTGVLRIPAASLVGHMNWATWHFHDIVWRKLKGRNPFGNEGVKYSGSPGGAAEDEALNQRVLRYRAEPAAIADLGTDADPTGRLHLPVLTMHGIDDPVAFVELESSFRQTMADASRAANLVQVFTRDHEHSYTSDAQYLAATEALLGWVQRKKTPTPADVAARCQALHARWDPAKGCRIEPGYKPAPLASRVPERIRGIENLSR
jgi:hypothetical protein